MLDYNNMTAEARTFSPPDQRDYGIIPPSLPVPNGNGLPTLFIDHETRRIAVGDGQILQCREGYTYPTVDLLTRYAGEEVAYGDIDEVLSHSSGWGYPTVGEAVKRVRRLLGDNLRDPRLILSVRNTVGKVTGYRLEADVAPLSERPMAQAANRQADTIMEITQEAVGEVKRHIEARRAAFGIDHAEEVATVQTIVDVAKKRDGEIIQRPLPKIESIKQAANNLTFRDKHRKSRPRSKSPSRAQTLYTRTSENLPPRPFPASVFISPDLTLRPSASQGAIEKPIMTVIGNGKIPIELFSKYLLEERVKNHGPDEDAVQIILPYRSSLKEAEAKGIPHHGVFPPVNPEEIPKPPQNPKDDQSVYKHHGLQKKTPFNRFEEKNTS